MGPKASEKNDDNRVIIEGNAALAQAYAMNIIAIYQNYQWRLYTNGNQSPNEAWSHLEDNDTWQDGDLKGWRGAELDFWLGKASPAPGQAAPASSRPTPAAANGKATRKKIKPAPAGNPHKTSPAHRAVAQKKPTKGQTRKSWIAEEQVMNEYSSGCYSPVRTEETSLGGRSDGREYARDDRIVG